MSNGLGPELITNGTFDNDVSGWSILGSGVLTWVSGGTAAFQRSVNANDRFFQDVNVTVGRCYLLSVDYVSGLSLTLRSSVLLPGGATLTLDRIMIDAGHGYVFLAPSTGFAQLSFGVTGNGTVGFDNISFREIQGGGGGGKRLYSNFG